MYMYDVNGINFTNAPSGVSETRTPQETGFGTIKFEKTVPTTTPQAEENIDKTLERMFKDGSMEKLLMETIPDDKLRARVLEILNPANKNIDTLMDYDDPGTAQYIGQTGMIIINTSPREDFHGTPRAPWTKMSQTQKLKTLIHEAMHYAQDTSVNSQEEELLCESTAIRTAAKFAQMNSMEDCVVCPPNHKLSEVGSMTDEELNQFLNKNFIKGPYSNRRKFKDSGEVSISGANNTGLHIPDGAEIRVGDREPFVIGETLLEGQGGFAGTVCNFVKVIDGKPYTIGTVVFEDIEPLVHETEDPRLQKYLNPSENDHYNNAVIVIEGREYKLKIFDFQPLESPAR